LRRAFIFRWAWLDRINRTQRGGGTSRRASRQARTELLAQGRSLAKRVRRIRTPLMCASYAATACVIPPGHRNQPFLRDNHQQLRNALNLGEFNE